MILNLLSVFYLVGVLIVFLLNIIVGEIWEIKDMTDDYLIVKKKPLFILGFSAFTFTFSLFAFPFKWHLLILLFLFLGNVIFVQLVDVAQCSFIIAVGLFVGFFTFKAYSKTRKWEQSLQEK
jgi:hypothetical protein